MIVTINSDLVIATVKPIERGESSGFAPQDFSDRSIEENSFSTPRELRNALRGVRSRCHFSAPKFVVQASHTKQ